jgi:heat shock protein HslJ
MPRAARFRLIGLLAVSAVTALTLGAVGASGCGGSQSSLAGTMWRLGGWSASSLDPAEFTITAEFTDTKIGGTSAVNQYGGPYTADANGSFSAGRLASTQMAGPEPAMRAETIYLKLLQEATKYVMADGTLTLSDANDNQLLIFTAAK